MKNIYQNTVYAGAAAEASDDYAGGQVYADIYFLCARIRHEFLANPGLIVISNDKYLQLIASHKVVSQNLRFTENKKACIESVKGYQTVGLLDSILLIVSGADTNAKDDLPVKPVDYNTELAVFPITDAQTFIQKKTGKTLEDVIASLGIK